MSKFSQTMFSSIRKSKNSIAAITKSTPLLNLVSIALVITLGMLYVAQVNGATTKGYQMRDIELQIEQLGSENQKLEIGVVEAQSMDSVVHGVQMLGMVKDENAIYVKPDAPAVAILP